ncbi:glycosyltransferase [Phormidium sp. FACHB-1136]|uniref:glycosyltransferase n=1 Tax=Phormidium sp. FACHB-1136 TaxID=2692848 RepID=UPI0016822042|nr:glycosyltransferase [Phormidium sp. FACHB-1136]MBD2426758.1 glycosyltransferase family 2 protein [Phormidium sp. FACHB-1136]
MSPPLTVIICTHNPRQDYLIRVIAALQQQTLAPTAWNLLLIDNASNQPVESWLTLDWHPQARMVVETTLGLTAARQRAFRETQTPTMVFVDDDNVLSLDYLEQVIALLDRYPQVGAMGGKCLPEFERPPAEWFQAIQIPMGLLETDARHLALGRTGASLTSGEDNDMMLTLLEQGWAVGYFPQLSLLHLIAARRLEADYLRRMNRASCRSWVQVLDLHDLRPWPKIPAWTLPLRQLKSYLALRPWTGTAAAIRWQGACGLLEGQARLS